MLPSLNIIFVEELVILRLEAESKIVNISKFLQAYIKYKKFSYLLYNWCRENRFVKNPWIAAYQWLIPIGSAIVYMTAIIVQFVIFDIVWYRIVDKLQMFRSLYFVRVILHPRYSASVKSRVVLKLVLYRLYCIKIDCIKIQYIKIQYIKNVRTKENKPDLFFATLFQIFFF